ncbi:hypothetical protein BC826DRAFT_970144 [Russula brevipes]|nr:hypothetical protein BC826DRAFT_970144 [Russula brevipes]
MATTPEEVVRFWSSPPALITSPSCRFLHQLCRCQSLASFTFEPVGRMFTCGLTEVRWTYTGNPAPLTLNISNINVAQQAPLSPLPTNPPPTSPPTTTVPRLRRQSNGYGGAYLPPVNVILAAGIDPTPGNWTWPGVTVPQGWYQMLAYVQGVLQTSSSSFFVMNGTNTDCVVQYAVAPSTPAQYFDIVNPRPSCYECCLIIGAFSHRRPAPIVAMKIAPVIGETSFGFTALEADQTFVGSEEEVSTVDHEKAIAAAQRSMPAYQPTRSQSLRTSTQSHGYTASNAEPLARRASCSAHPGEAIPLERTHTAGGGAGGATGPRRKPAPRYDGPEVEVGYTGRSSSQTTLDSIHGNAKGSGGPGGGHVLRHQSSFGAMRPMHVDMPEQLQSAGRAESAVLSFYPTFRFSAALLGPAFITCRMPGHNLKVVQLFLVSYVVLPIVPSATPSYIFYFFELTQRHRAPTAGESL